MLTTGYLLLTTILSRPAQQRVSREALQTQIISPVQATTDTFLSLWCYHVLL
jgi:hypothetical protein